jgi:hypothetical protein
MGLFRMAIAVVGRGGEMPARYGAQGLFLLLLGLGITDFHDASDHAVPWLFGLAFLLNGIYQGGSALIIRFPNWGWFLASGAGHVLAAAGLFLYWRQAMTWVIPVLLGGSLALLGASALRLAWRLRRFGAHGEPLGLAERIAYYLEFHLPRRFRRSDYAGPQAPPETGDAHGDLLVHIWTPTAVARVERPAPNLMSYFLAQDREGKITVGHAALEMAPDVYISHCDGDPGGYSDAQEAWRELRSKDGHGVFLASFQAEIEHYLQPSVTLRFRNFRADQLRACWHLYRQTTTYNLTNRNCSVAVAVALEAALMGSMGGASRTRSLLALLLNRDLWLAHFLRWKAREMVWTPGMMLD